MIAYCNNLYALKLFFKNVKRLIKKHPLRIKKTIKIEKIYKNEDVKIITLFKLFPHKNATFNKGQY